MSDKCDMKLKLVWLTTIGPKWQVVIPKDVRDQLNIKAWDQFAVLIKNNKYVWLVQSEDLASLMQYIEEEK